MDMRIWISNLPRNLRENGEKVVLGLAVVAALLLLRDGLRVEVVHQEPNDLQSLARRAQHHTEIDSWPKIKDNIDRVVIARFEEEEKHSSLPTSALAYSLKRPLSPPLLPMAPLRRDPILLPATDISVKSMVVPVALPNPEELSDPLDALDWLGGGDKARIGQRMSWFRRGTYTPPQGRFVIGAGDGPPVVLPKPALLIAVTALVPYEKQLEKYLSTFEDTIAYERRRDHPHYISFVVERAEVIEGAPLHWVVVGNAGKAMLEARNWPAPLGAPEVVEQQYLLLGATTMPVPTILQRKYEQFANHPLLYSLAQQAHDELAEENERSGAAKDGTAGKDGGLNQDSDLIPDGIPQGIPLGNRLEQNDSLNGPNGGGNAAREGAQGFNPMLGGAPDGDNVITKFKLLRFFDATAEMSKRYRYRVQLVLEDPNNPRDITQGVDLRSLHVTAAARVFEQRRTGRVRDMRRVDNFYRMSEFSEPSAIVSLNNDERKFVGMVKGISFERNDALAEVTRSKVIGRIVAVKTDVALTKLKLAADIPARFLVSPGDMLSSLGDVDIVHPVSLAIKTLRQYDFEGSATVVDFYGGYKVSGNVGPPLYSPGYYALVDEVGNLIVQEEKRDLTDYRDYDLDANRAGNVANEDGELGREGDGVEGINDDGRRRRRSRR
jgi:hypothetical protein